MKSFEMQTLDRIVAAWKSDLPGAQPWIDGVFPGYFQFEGTWTAAGVAADSAIVNVALSSARIPTGKQPPGTTDNPPYYFFARALNLQFFPTVAEVDQQAYDALIEAGEFYLDWRPSGTGGLWQPIGHCASMGSGQSGVADDAGPVYSSISAITRPSDTVRLNSPVMANLTNGQESIIIRNGAALPAVGADVRILATFLGAWATSDAARSESFCTYGQACGCNGAPTAGKGTIPNVTRG